VRLLLGLGGGAGARRRTGGLCGCGRGAGLGGQRLGGRRGRCGAVLLGEGLGAVVLLPRDVEDLGRVRGLRPAATALAAAGRLASRRGVLRGHALLEGLIADIAEAVVVALGLLLLAAASAGSAGALRRGLLLVDRGVHAAGPQSEGDAFGVLLLAAADHHLVDTAQPRGD